MKEFLKSLDEFLKELSLNYLLEEFLDESLLDPGGTAVWIIGRISGWIYRKISEEVSVYMLKEQCLFNFFKNISELLPYVPRENRWEISEATCGENPEGIDRQIP